MKIIIKCSECGEEIDKEFYWNDALGEMVVIVPPCPCDDE